MTTTSITAVNGSIRMPKLISRLPTSSQERGSNVSLSAAFMTLASAHKDRANPIASEPMVEYAATSESLPSRGRTASALTANDASGSSRMSQMAVSLII